MRAKADGMPLFHEQCGQGESCLAQEGSRPFPKSGHAYGVVNSQIYPELRGAAALQMGFSGFACRHPLQTKPEKHSSPLTVIEKSNVSGFISSQTPVGGRLGRRSPYQ